MAVFRGFVSGFVFATVLYMALYWAPVSVLDLLTSRSFPVHSHDEIEGAIFISGCSSGIGRHAALSLAEQGYHVFATVRKEKDVQSLLKDDASGRLHPLLCDVSSAEQIVGARDEVVAWLNERRGEESKPRGLLGVVNNAGITSELELVEHMPLQTLRNVFEINVEGPFLVYQTFLPLIREHKGRIINVGSLAGITARPFRGAYTISKFALEGLSDTIRQELSVEDISVSMVNPGYVQTPIAAKNFQETASKYGKAGAASRSELTEVQKEMLAGFEASHRKAFEGAMGPKETTTVAILDALTSPKPKTRYNPGTIGMGPIPAWAFPKLKMLLPDRLVDKVTIKRKPLPVNKQSRKGAS